MNPEWRWRGGALGIGVLIGYLLHPASPAHVEVRTVTHETVKWKTNEVIRTLPGATATLHPDGTTTLTGPVEIGRTSEGSASRTEDSHTQIESDDWHIALNAGVALPRPAIVVGIDYRIGTLFKRVGVGAGAWGELPFGSYIPNRGGVRLLLTF